MTRCLLFRPGRLLPYPGQLLAAMLWLLASLGSPVRAAYEAEMAAFAAQDAANPPPRDVIVFTGSSSITGWSGMGAAFPGFPVLNRGFGGSQMHDVLDKFDHVVTPYQPPLIVLYEGDNDIWAGETPAAVFAEYLSFVNRVAAELPATDIILVAVKPSPSRVSRMAAMAELNGMLRDLCATRPRLRYADVFTPMLDGAGQPRPELFGSDMLHMNAAGYAIWKTVLAPLVASAPFAGGDSFRFDFGAGSDPAAPGWNLVSGETGASSTGNMAGLVNTSGEVTTAGLEMITPFNAVNAAGTTVAALFPVAATRDSLFGNTELFEGKENCFPSFRLTGLDPALAYRLTFYASRTGVTDNRETRYTVTGTSTVSTQLNASANIDRVTMVSGIRPDSSHAITVALAPGSANNSPNHFTYLGVLKVDGLAAPPPDTTPPLLTTGSGRSGTVIELTFNEPLDAATATVPAAYSVNNGSATVSSAVLAAGGAGVSLTLAGPVSGSVTVAVSGVRDLAGNAVAAGTQVVFNMPAAAVPGVMKFDFGAAGTSTEPGDDSGNTWNNIGPAVAGSDTGILNGLVTAANQPTTASLRMIRRFNAVNSNGTNASGLFPADATVDSFYGNTQTFNSQTNIFPAFKLTGLDTSRRYDFTFYASRLDVGDNRETRYTVTGLNTVVTHLQVARNISGTATATSLQPDASGEISISLTAGPNNNNGNLFTYLGVMMVAPAPPPDLLPPQLENGRVRLDWTGPGQLQYAENPAGPWIFVQPAPAPPWMEDLHPSGRRFYRLHPASD